MISASLHLLWHACTGLGKDNTIFRKAAGAGRNRASGRKTRHKALIKIVKI
jgi:ribosomal protein L27